jgi:hypothetical protein
MPRRTSGSGLAVRHAIPHKKSRRRALPASIAKLTKAPTDAVKTSSAAATAAITNPVTFALCRGKLVTIAMKSPHGRVTPSQRATREALLRAGAQWWECRSANAAMWALCKSGVPFDRPRGRHEGDLAAAQACAVEAPRCDPSEPRPGAGRAARQRSLDRKREKEAAQLAAECDQERNIDGGDGELLDNRWRTPRKTDMCCKQVLTEVTHRGARV